jgi:hypothetical protein
VTGVTADGQIDSSPDSAITFTYYSGPTATGTPLAGVPTNAGQYTAVAHYSGNSNYTSADSSARTISIGKATLSVTANSKTITYGQSIPTLDATITGFQSSDTQAALTGSPHCTTTVSDPAGAGSYTITCTQGTLTDTTGNYKFSFSTGTLTVNQATVHVDTNPKTVVYGTAPTLDATLRASDFRYTDTATTSGITGSASCAEAPPEIAVGTYPTDIVCSPGSGPGSLKAANYTFLTGTAGALTINQATLSVTANSKTITYGQSIPTLDAVITSFQYSDTRAALTGSPHCTTTVSDPAGAGSYTITCTQGTLADTTGNYKFSFSTGALIVNQATVRVDANAKTVVYGTAPTLDATLRASDFQYSDTATTSGITGSASCAETPPKTYVGTYTGDIVCNRGTLAAANYTFATGNAGTLTINPWNAAGYGFYAPVGVPNSVFTPSANPLPTPTSSTIWNSIKGGQTVPLKFNVYAGTVEQTTLSAFPATPFTLTGVSCPSNAATDLVDFTTTGSNSLRYDTTAMQWIQNWQTPKGSGKCYRATMNFADGSALSAFFTTT